MRRLFKLVFPLAALIVAVGLAGITQAQEAPQAPPVELPFIDRDSDGINDMVQNGWGFRFLERYKKRQLIWEQLKGEVLPEKPTQPDAGQEREQKMADFLQQKMNEMIDTDNDGVADTPLGEYMGRQFQAIDKDGDGLPDDISKEQMREHMKKMRDWRNEVWQRINDGRPPFIDANRDGIPDNLPDGFGWRGYRPLKP